MVYKKKTLKNYLHYTNDKHTYDKILYMRYIFNYDKIPLASNDI